MSRETGVHPLKTNPRVCGPKVITTSSLRERFSPLQVEEGMEMIMKWKGEKKKSREMKQEMPPKRRTSLFKVNLHKQKAKC